MRHLKTITATSRASIIRLEQPSFPTTLFRPRRVSSRPLVLAPLFRCSLARMSRRPRWPVYPTGCATLTIGDWNPRLGLAWQPWSNGKTVIRGGIGRFTQSLLGQFAWAPTGIATSDTRTYVNYQGPGVLPLFTLPNVSPPLSNLGSGGIEIFGPAGVDPNFRDPYSYQWNFTIERELPWSALFRATYTGVQSVGMPVIVDYNQVPPSTAPWSQQRTPFPLWANLYSLEPIGFSNYQGMQLEASRRFRHDLFFQTSDVLAKDLGEAGAPPPSGNFPTEYTGNAANAITDRFDTRYDRGNLSGARRNTFLLNGLFPLPLGKERAIGAGWHGLEQGLLGGWELSTVTLIESGPYQTPRINNSLDRSNTGLVPPGVRSVQARPDRIGNGNLANPTTQMWYDPSAFVPVPKGAGRFGDAGAGILEGPGTVAIAMGLAKTFQLSEKAPAYRSDIHKPTELSELRAPYCEHIESGLRYVDLSPVGPELWEPNRAARRTPLFLRRFISVRFWRCG